MLPRTAFLSRLIGGYCVVVPPGMMNHRQASIGAAEEILHSPCMMMSLGVWSGGPAPVLVTLVGWISLLKGLTFLFLPPNDEARLLEMLGYRELFFAYTGFSVLLGTCLLYAGSRAH